MKPLLAGLQRKVAAYLEQTGMTGRQFDISALQSFGFVSRLNRGCAPNLDTADRVLRFIGEPPIGSHVPPRNRGFPQGHRHAGDRVRPRGHPGSRFRQEAEEGGHRCNLPPSIAFASGCATTQAHRNRLRSLNWWKTPQRIRSAPLRTRCRGACRRELHLLRAPPTRALRPRTRRCFYPGTRPRAFLTFSYRTLERFRRDGTGPAHYKLGKQIVYSPLRPSPMGAGAAPGRARWLR